MGEQEWDRTRKLWYSHWEALELSGRECKAQSMSGCYTMHREPGYSSFLHKQISKGENVKVQSQAYSTSPKLTSHISQSSHREKKEKQQGEDGSVPPVAFPSLGGEWKFPSF